MLDMHRPTPLCRVKNEGILYNYKMVEKILLFYNYCAEAGNPF